MSGDDATRVRNLFDEQYVVALDKHNTPMAKKSFEKVVKLDPNDADARVGLAQAALASFYGGSGKYSTAADYVTGTVLTVDGGMTG